MRQRKVDYPVKPCSVCGEEFKPKTFKSHLCSHRCRQRQDKGHIPLADHHDKVRAEAKGRKESTCIHCGKVFTAKAGGWALKQIEQGNDDWGKYCSQQCRREYGRIHIQKRGERTIKFTPIKFTQCEACGKWFLNRTCAKVCSDACRHRAYVMRVDRDRVNSRTIHCVICGVHFSRLFKNDNWTCSPTCKSEQSKNAKRDHRHKRRAAIYGAGYERFNVKEIFDRDGWKCKACGCKTPKNKRSTTADNAPELDHIIPVSKGGPHTRANTQLLCRSCNSAKGAGSLQDQMRLF